MDNDLYSVKRLITFKYIRDIMFDLRIENLKLDFRSTISLEDYELFLGLDSLNRIDCYYMPKFIKEKFEIIFRSDNKTS